MRPSFPSPRRAPSLGTLALVLVALAGCGTARGGAAAGTDRDYIAPGEVTEAITVQNAYLLVQRLRPLWLRERGKKSILFDQGIIVYEGRMLRGNVESLQYIPTIDVHSVRFLPPDRANLIYGVGHPHGAIVVEVKSGL